MADDGVIVHEELVEAWGTLAGLVPGSRELRTDGLFAVCSGLPVPFFNPWFPLGDDAGADDLEAVRDFYREAGLGGTGWLLRGRHPRLRAALADAGVEVDDGPGAMLLRQVPDAPPPPPPGLTIERVDDAAGLEHLVDVLAAGYEMPRELAAVFANERWLGLDDFAMLLGYVDGVPVSTASAHLRAGPTGVYSVATPPEHRGRGYGAALSWAAVMAGAERGSTSAVLQSSEMGHAVYAAMGFEDVGVYDHVTIGP